MSAEWANSILVVHNSERAAVGVPPLVWSNSLAAGAQAWAEHLAATGTGTLVHATDAQKGCPCGEVLAGFDWSKGPTAPGGERLYGSPKRTIITGDQWVMATHPMGSRSVITRRWSGATNKRSVAGPPMVVHTAF